MRGRLIGLMLVALLVPVSVAAAKGGSPATPAKGGPAATAAKGGSMKLLLPNAYFVHKSAVIVPNRYQRVHGDVWPYLKDQKGTVTRSIGKHVIGRETSWIYPSKNKRYGVFN